MLYINPDRVKLLNSSLKEVVSGIHQSGTGQNLSLQVGGALNLIEANKKFLQFDGRGDVNFSPYASFMNGPIVEYLKDINNNLSGGLYENQAEASIKAYAREIQTGIDLGYGYQEAIELSKEGHLSNDSENLSQELREFSVGMHLGYYYDPNLEYFKNQDIKDHIESMKNILKNLNLSGVLNSIEGTELLKSLQGLEQIIKNIKSASDTGKENLELKKLLTKPYEDLKRVINQTRGFLEGLEAIKKK